MSTTRFHGTIACILCTGIVDKEIFSLLIGNLKDIIGLKSGMIVLYLPLAYILSISFRARPIVKNAILGKSTGD